MIARKAKGQSKTQTQSKYWDKTAQKYARRPVADQTVYREKLRLTREFFTPKSRVFEFGCGTGSTAIAHAPFVKTIDALDTSDAMLAIAKEKAKQGKVQNISFQNGTIESFMPPSVVSAPQTKQKKQTRHTKHAHYDVVLGMSILHLLPDPATAIAKCYELLKSGGVLITSTPCLQDAAGFLRVPVSIGHRLGLFPYVNFFTSDELRSNLRAAGAVAAGREGSGASAGAGFDIIHDWRPSSKKTEAIFLIAQKPARTHARSD